MTHVAVVSPLPKYVCMCVCDCESFATQEGWQSCLGPKALSNSQNYTEFSGPDPGNQKERNGGLVSSRFCCLSSEQVPDP